MTDAQAPVTCGQCGVENEHDCTTCTACGYCWQVVDVPIEPFVCATCGEASNATFRASICSNGFHFSSVPSVTIDRTIPGADGHVGIECTLPDGRRVRVSVEPEGEVCAVFIPAGGELPKSSAYRDIPIATGLTMQKCLNAVFGGEHGPAAPIVTRGFCNLCKAAMASAEAESHD